MTKQQGATSTSSRKLSDVSGEEGTRQASISGSNSPSSSSISSSNSISLIKLDELSSFGATKQSRLPALIKLNNNNSASSMPTFSGSEVEKMAQGGTEKQQSSLPADLVAGAQLDKENVDTSHEPDNPIEADYQVVDMATDLMGPSLPQLTAEKVSDQLASKLSIDEQRQALATSLQMNQQHSTNLGDSLIDMIINLRTENQNLVRALETNNEYVKERLNEFKRVQEEAKRRESQFALEKAEHEHQVRKLARQNLVLSERLKSMEAKLKEMKLEVSESLVAAHSSRASSVRDEAAPEAHLYPALNPADESFGNSALGAEATTMQVDAAADHQERPPSAPPMEPSIQAAGPSSSPGARLANMTKEELSKHFDTEKAAFYAMDDPMKQCDRLEQQLNDIGKRDYEICLLQQQLNIYRQDFRLERLANLEAKIQIEKLKNDIDRLCYERLKEQSKATGADKTYPKHHPGAGFLPCSDVVMSKLGQHLSKKAAKTAARAAKYAAKQAHRDEKAAKAAAAAAATLSTPAGGPAEHPVGETHQHHRRHSHHHHHRQRAIRSEVVNDLLSTANKAMLTGYKMASTHVNLALDKLSQFEQAQASNLAQNRQAPAPAASQANASVSQMDQPSMD